MPILATAVLLLSIADLRISTTQAVVTSVDIDARWVGLGDPIEEHFRIIGDERGYRSGLGRVDPSRIRDLTLAVTSHPISEQDALRELLNSNWLNENAGPAYKVLTSAQGECSHDARELFVSAFTDRKRATRALHEHYSVFHTDDFPSINVRITTRDGRVIATSSHSQHALMLPWTTPNGASWNPAVPRAVAALIPHRSRLRPRVLDDSLVAALAWETGEAIRAQWEALEERCLYRRIAENIEQHGFRIEKIYHAWPGQFAGHLSRTDFPRNLIVDAHIDAGPKTLAALPKLLHQIEIHVATARAFVQAHPDITFEMWYRDGLSLTDDSVQLHELSRPSDANTKRARTLQPQCVLLSDHNDHNSGRRWVVLPTGEAIPWAE